MKCKCGKEYKTERGYKKHLESCKYKDLDLNKVLWFGKLLHSVDKRLFYVHFGKINKHKKDNNIGIETAKQELLKSEIIRYRKSLWDIITYLREYFIQSEIRDFIEWVFKTYHDITIISLKSILLNEKVIYRFNLEYTFKAIKKRIDDSLILVHTHKVFYNDFEFIDFLTRGELSIYYVIFNDYLAIEWFNRLDKDLQSEIEYNVKLASEIIINQIKPNEFDLLYDLANTDTPIIQEL